jgi:hypothetical protein
MKTNGFTPGPWEIGEQYLGCRDIFAPMPGDEPNVEICSTSGLPEEEDDIANARLIAAAPDLLAAAECALADLEGIMPIYELSGDRKHPAWKTMNELRVAIAAARKEA